MKWLLVVVSAALIAMFALWQRNTVKTTYVNGLPAYNQLPNREFILQRDAYIFKLDAHASSFPFVGTHDTVPQLPSEVDRKAIGQAIPGVRILDVVPTGVPVKIVSVRRDQSREHTAVTFELLFLDEPERKYVRVDGYYLLDHAHDEEGIAPRFLEQLAVPRVRK